MTNKNRTKRALVLSVLSLLLCCSMLVGTTFAWFTDSVTSTNNKIVSGRLDVSLEYYDGKDWVEVDENTNVFEEDALWEPGHTEVVYLKVTNVGNLAFDYKLGINIAEETPSINVYDGDFKLSDYIVMGAVEGVNTVYASRTDARNALVGKEVKAIKEGYAKSGTLYAKDDAANSTPTEEYVALVVYMPETVGNEANYKKGAVVPTVTLGINLLATQETYEKDSFDELYDKDAVVSVPPVPVSEQTITEVTIFDPFGANQPQETLQNVTLDVYDFVANNYSDVYPLDEYKDWYCDFFVSTDKALDEGLVLLGNYGSFGWLGFWAPESTEAYSPTPLLGSVTSGGNGFTYDAICNDVKIFRCGLIDYKDNNTGTKVTVELRMTNPADANEVITVSSITVELGK